MRSPSSLAIISSLVAVCASATADLQLLYEWQTLDWSWDAVHTKESYLENGLYIPANCALTGVKVAPNGDVYVTVPRWRSGVPATLNKVVQKDGTPVLAAWPSWDVQDIDDSSDLQSVQSMLIDSKNRMWVIDTGRRNFLAEPETIVNGAPKLWIIDVETGEVLHRYTFPDDVAPYDSSFINDLVLDESREIAYISEAGTGAIVVYDYNSNTSRRFSDITTKNEPEVPLVINENDYGTSIFTTPTDGIALSEDNEIVYYCALQGLTLYSVPAKALRDFGTTNDEISAQVVSHGAKMSPSDGLIIYGNTLYFGGLTTNTLYAWDTSLKTLTPENQQVVAVNEATLQWIDTFALAGNTLYLTSNKLDLYITNSMEAETDANYRVFALLLHKESCATA